jgi:nicotinate-nucleotide pyrophosphorylase (carboxylating)
MAGWDFNEWLEGILNEDIGTGDHSTLASIPIESQGQAVLLVKQPGIIAGVEVARRILKRYDEDLACQVKILDGQPVNVGDIVFSISGSARSILTIERTVLNVMQRLSGIATKTRSMVDLISHTNAKLLDTRKTTPGMRTLEKSAVLLGGGQNHRHGLYDMIMLKDNHIDYCGGVAKAIEATHAYLAKHNLKLKIEIEVRNLLELAEVVGCGGVDRVMLDNFGLNEIKEALVILGGQIETEASGGINENTIVGIAETGVDYISVGALTHSVSSLDLSLKAFSPNA